MKPETSIPGQGAQKSQPNTAGPSTDRGTGVEGPHARPETGHWLKFNQETLEITGCQCGFAADTDSDCGWGDSVVAHLLEVGAETASPDVDGWTVRPHPDGIGLYHSCDSRAFLTGPAFPVGAVLAYIADPPVPDGEPGYTAESVACPACRAQSTEEDTE